MTRRFLTVIACSVALALAAPAGFAADEKKEPEKKKEPMKDKKSSFDGFQLRDQLAIVWRAEPRQRPGEDAQTHPAAYAARLAGRP